MGRLIVFEWMSLDGVFDADSMDRWWLPYDSQARQQVIQQTYLASDGYLMGRTTYEMLAPYWSSLKHNEMGIAGKFNAAPKYVASSTMKVAEWHNTTIIGGDVQEQITALKQQEDRTLLVIGSAILVQSLAQSGLVDEYKFLVQPVVMGRGRRVFGDGMSAGLQLIKAESLERGVVLLHYRSAGAS